MVGSKTETLSMMWSSALVIKRSRICLSCYVACLTCWVMLKHSKIFRNWRPVTLKVSSTWKLKSPTKRSELESVENCSKKVENPSKNILLVNLLRFEGGGL
jgi:hypothetical protein